LVEPPFGTTVNFGSASLSPMMTVVPQTTFCSSLAAGTFGVTLFFPSGAGTCCPNS